MICASVAIQVLPNCMNKKETVRIVDQVINYIKSTGVSYFVGPFETTMEGDYDQLMEIVKNCQLIAVEEGCPSVMSYVKINYQKEGGVLTIEEKTKPYHL